MVTSTLTSGRVMTSCPLCGFRQRIDRLTGLEFQVKDMEKDLLPLEALLVYSDKGVHGLRSVKQTVSLPASMEQEMLWALAAKMLPLVRYLQFKVPDFREATTDVLEVVVVLDQVVKRDVERRMTVDMRVKFEGEVDGVWRDVKTEWGVPPMLRETWPPSKSAIKSSKRESESLSPKAASPYQRALFDQPVPMDSPVNFPTKTNQ